MRTEKIAFPNEKGLQLAAYLEWPEEKTPDYFALFAHCFTCSKNIKAAKNISQSLADENVGVLRFDFTGLGESEGDFADTNFSSNIRDLVSASAFLEDNVSAPQILIGHSLGGAAVLQAAHFIPSCKAVVTIGAPSEPSHVQHLFTDSLEKIERDGKAKVVLAGRSFTIEKQFIDDLNEHAMNCRIDELNRALLIFHSPIDNTVGIDNAASIFTRAKHPKSFVSLDQADHLLMNEQDSGYVGRVIAAWAGRYL